MTTSKDTLMMSEGLEDLLDVSALEDDTDVDPLKFTLTIPGWNQASGDLILTGLVISFEYDSLHPNRCVSFVTDSVKPADVLTTINRVTTVKLPSKVTLSSGRYSVSWENVKALNVRNFVSPDTKKRVTKFSCWL